MKKLFKIISGMVLVTAALYALTVIRGDTYLWKALWACYLHGAVGPTISDARFFQTNNIEASPQASDWPLRGDYNKSELPAKLQSVLSETGTVAFLMVQDDSIFSEYYWQGYSDSVQSNSFSMAKNITTILAQIAIQKGVFTGWHERVNTVLPELKGQYADELELWHLSTMSSGLDWDENYDNPWAITARSYYGEDIRKVMLELPISSEPGKSFNYQSGSTQLLALTLIKATGKSLSELTEEWLWKPLQAEHDATWHTDGQGTELAYCCFNSNARDFARFGKLMLHYGNWNGTQILDSSFVKMATAAALAPEYGYSFWLDHSQGTKVYYQWGFLGQYIITLPEYNIVVVRLGNADLPEQENSSEYCRVITRKVLKMVKD